MRFLNRFIEQILGAPGVILFIPICITLVMITANPNPPPKTQDECEALGGKWKQTMKTYHTCILPQSTV